MRNPRLHIPPATILVLGLCLAAPALLQAQQAADLTGTWRLQTEVLIDGEELPCIYAGTANIVDQSGDLTGSAELLLQSGPAACPGEMSAALSGATDPGAEQIFVNGTLSGQLGALTFSGTLTPNPGGGGDFDVTQGPFAGEQGTWAAQLVRSILEIPELTPLGLAILTLLLLAGGAWLLKPAH